MVAERERTEVEQLEDVWALVDELGRLSLELKHAAMAARQALGLPSEEEDQQ